VKILLLNKNITAYNAFISIDIAIIILHLFKVNIKSQQVLKVLLYKHQIHGYIIIVQFIYSYLKKILELIFKLSYRKQY